MLQHPERGVSKRKTKRHLRKNPMAQANWSHMFSNGANRSTNLVNINTRRFKKSPRPKRSNMATSPRPRRPPWRIIYRKWYIRNREWRVETDPRYERLRQFQGPDTADRQTPCFWDSGARRRVIFGDNENDALYWNDGPSGTVWDESGIKHTPDTWDTLEQVVEQDTAFTGACYGVFAEAFRLEKERLLRSNFGWDWEVGSAL